MKTTTYTVTGNTYPERRELTALDWTWNAARKTWTGSKLSHQLRMAIKYRGLRLVSGPEIYFDERALRYRRRTDGRFVSAEDAAIEIPKAAEAAAPRATTRRPTTSNSWRVWRQGGWELAEDC